MESDLTGYYARICYFYLSIYKIMSKQFSEIKGFLWYIMVVLDVGNSLSTSVYSLTSPLLEKSKIPSTKMTVKEKSDRILPLFQQLTSLTRQQLPVEERDARLASAGRLPRGTLFSCFHEKHLEEATELFKILYSKRTFLYWTSVR